jgi:PAS domain S-box-containing protein
MRSRNKILKDRILKDRILIVDDEPRIAESLKTLLTDRGYEIDLALNAAGAIERINAEEFDLVLLDLMLPDMSGLEIIGLITDRSPHPLIIVLTGYASVDSAIECLKSGAYDYLKKPYEPEELMKRVQNALQQRRLEIESKVIRGRLEVSEKSYQYLVQNSPDIIYTLDQEGRFNFINGPIKEILGYENYELKGKHYTEIVHPDDWDKAKNTFNERRRATRGADYTELRLRVNPKVLASEPGRRDCRIVELRAKGIYGKSDSGEQAVQIGTYGVARDITERIEYEHLIRMSLQEKEVLLKEIHHRVKNNMQIVSSLMKLQERRLANDEVRNALQVSQNRITAMSLIHEILYRSDNLAEIDLQLYVKRLTGNLFSIFGVNTKSIDLHIDIPNIRLGINQAIPCGLILNELISNSLKHAFKESEGGEIRITASSIGEGDVELVVSDTGGGLPSNFNFEKAESLGLKLVRGLVVDQLDGSLELERDQGTRFKIRFRKAD